MYNYIICIPSYKRAKMCNEKTLDLLYKNKINKQLIYIYVANQEEYDEYNKILNKNFYNKLIIGVKGIALQREFIYNYWPIGQHLMFLDDDINKLDFSLSNLFKNKTLNYLIKYGFNECKKTNAYIWGIYPVYNPFFRKNKQEISTSLKFIIGAFYGVINRPHIKNIKNILAIKHNGQKEDVESSIRYFIEDGIILRFNRIGFLTKYYNPQGGIGSFQQRLKPMKEAAKRLNEFFPMYGNISIRKNNMHEFKLKNIPSIHNFSYFNNKTKNKNKNKNKTKKLH